MTFLHERKYQGWDNLVEDWIINDVEKFQFHNEACWFNVLLHELINDALQLRGAIPLV